MLFLDEAEALTLGWRSDLQTQLWDCLLSSVGCSRDVSERRWWWADLLVTERKITLIPSKSSAQINHLRSLQNRSSYRRRCPDSVGQRWYSSVSSHWYWVSARIRCQLGLWLDPDHRAAQYQQLETPSVTSPLITQADCSSLYWTYMCCCCCFNSLYSGLCVCDFIWCRNTLRTSRRYVYGVDLLRLSAGLQRDTNTDSEAESCVGFDEDANR